MSKACKVGNTRTSQLVVGTNMLHAAPVYISETVQQTMNPTFRHIDWSPCGPGITRQDNITIRVWVKGGKSADWQQLLLMNIALGSLHYVGKSVCRPSAPVPIKWLTGIARHLGSAAAGKRCPIAVDRWRVYSTY